MKIPRARHDWGQRYDRATSLQRELAHEVRYVHPDKPFHLIAGVDVSYPAGKDFCIAGVVVWDMEKREVVERHFRRHVVRFPYIPGLLSFREAPAIISVLRTLNTVPDVILCDGQGIAHPRRLGIASHIGVLTGMPAIGCAKSRLVGRYEAPSPRKGSRSPLLVGNERIGTVLRTRDGVRPVFVSVGHLIDLPAAEEIVLSCAVRYRLPEPTRLADHLVSSAARSMG